MAENPDSPDIDSDSLQHTEMHDYSGGILILPTYDDVTLAPEYEGSLAYATGDGPTSEGVYKFEEGVGWTGVGGGGSGGASDLSDLTIDTSKDWGGFSITNFGSLNGVTVESHSARHESGGADEMDVSGLSGSLEDDQTPTDHATQHHEGNADELDPADLAAAGTAGQFLSVSGWSDPPDSNVGVEDDGAGVVGDAVVLNFGTNLSVTDDGGGEVTITASTLDTRVDVDADGENVVDDVSVIDFTGDLDVSNPTGDEVVVDLVKYTDEEAQDAVGTILDDGQFDYDDSNGIIDLSPHANTADAHHTKTTDMDDMADIQGVAALDMDTLANRPSPGQEDRIYVAEDGGVYRDTGSAWDLIAVLDHGDLTGVSSDDHHTKYTDSEAVSAVEAADPLSPSEYVAMGPGRKITWPATGYIVIDRDDTISGTSFAVQHNSPVVTLLRVNDDGTVNAPQGNFENGGDPVASSSTGTQYDIQKDGTDGAGVINFKTQ